MIIDKEREEFESWYRKQYGVFDCDDRLKYNDLNDEYFYPFVDGMFHVWQLMTMREAELLARIAELEAENKKLLVDKIYANTVRKERNDLVAEIERLKDILFDGYAVLQEIQKNPKEAEKTGSLNVSHVLDAVVRLIRKSSQEKGND